MARLFDDASFEYLQAASAVVSGPPFTLACWFYSNDLTAGQTLISIGDAVTDWHELQASGTIGGDPLRVTSWESGPVYGVAATTSGFSANTWHHACGVFASTASRSVYIDGGSKGSDTTTVTPSSLAYTAVGRRIKGTPDFYMSGRIAEAAIWNVALTDAQVAALARRICPHLIRPDKLKACWRIGHGSPEPDFSGGGYNLTVTGTSIADHAPVGPMLWLPDGWQGITSTPITLTPDPVVVQVTAPSVTIDLGTLTLTPDPVMVNVTAPAVTLDMGTLTLTPGPVVVNVTAPAVTLDMGTLTLTPGPVAVNLIVPSVSVSVGVVTLTPDPVVVSIAVPGIAIAQGPIKTVTKTIGGTGRDYTSLAAAAADIGAVVKSGDTLIWEVHNDGILWSFNAAINLSTLGDTGTFKITVPEAERHNGRAATGARLKCLWPWGTHLDIDCGGWSTTVLVEHLEIEGRGLIGIGYTAGTVALAVRNGTGAATLRGLIIHNLLISGAWNTVVGIYINMEKVTVYNNLIYDMRYTGGLYAWMYGILDNYGGNEIYNNTIDQIETAGICVLANATSVRGNAVFRCGAGWSPVDDGRAGVLAFLAAAGVSWSPASGYNVADDSTPPGTNNKTGVDLQDQFVSPLRWDPSSWGQLAGADYHLIEGADCIWAGADLSSSFTDDIDGDERQAPWDAGADQGLFPVVTGYDQTRQGNLTEVVAVGRLIADSLPLYYHWYIDGSHVAMTTTPRHAIYLARGEQARVEVIVTTDADFDAVANAPVGHPGRRVLSWVRSLDDDVAYYRVDQRKDGGAASIIGRVHRRPAQWTYELLTPYLDDLADYQWDIVPVDHAGNEGTAVARQERIVRTPAAPDFTATFDPVTARVAFAGAT